MPDPSPSTLTVLNSNFLQLGRRSGGPATADSLPQAVYLTTVKHTALVGIEPTTFRSWVRRATSLLCYRDHRNTIRYDTIGEFNVDWKAEEIIILTVKPSCGVDKRKQKQSQRHSRSHCIWVFGLWWRLFHSGPSLTSQQCVGLIRIITAYSSRPTMAYPILTGASDSVIRNVLTYLVSKTYICIAHFAKASNALITSCLLVLLFRLIWSLPFFRLPPVPVSRGV